MQKHSKATLRDEIYLELELYSDRHLTFQNTRYLRIIIFSNANLRPKGQLYRVGSSHLNFDMSLSIYTTLATKSLIYAPIFWSVFELILPKPTPSPT